ncbi:MAG: DoxX family protein [Acidimicrobiia bacterium]|nr:DoxX family protein [Acidimicrobiia bacterium]
MSLVILIGRILYALVFVGSGIVRHLVRMEETSRYAASRGVPAATPLVLFSGLGIVAGGLGVGFGVWADLAVLGLVAYSLVAAVLVHHFWTDTDPVEQRHQTSHFMKNLSMAGGGLVLFGFLVAAGPAVDFTITDPVWSFDL